MELGGRDCHVDSNAREVRYAVERKSVDLLAGLSVVSNGQLYDACRLSSRLSSRLTMLWKRIGARVRMHSMYSGKAIHSFSPRNTSASQRMVCLETTYGST